MKSGWACGTAARGAAASPPRTASATKDALNMAVAIEGNTGDLLAAYCEANNSVRYRTWTSGGGWYERAVCPNIGGTPSAMTLSANPNGNQIMLSVMRDQQRHPFRALERQRGGARDNQLESSSGESQNQPILFPCSTMGELRHDEQTRCGCQRPATKRIGACRA